MLKLKYFTLLTQVETSVFVLWQLSAYILTRQNDLIVFLFVSFYMLISHVKKKIRKFVFHVLLLKSSYFFHSFIHILVKSNERGGRAETMTLPILKKAHVAYWKNGFDRNSSYIFCEKQTVLPDLKFYCVNTNWTYEQKIFSWSCSEKNNLRSKSRTSDPVHLSTDWKSMQWHPWDFFLIYQPYF